MGGVLKCDGERSDVRTERESPSSCKVGAGNWGGGVTGLAGRGDDARDADSELDGRGGGGGGSSRTMSREELFSG